MTELNNQNLSLKSNPGDLPRIKHFLKLSVENTEIVIDISDETGGLGLKMFFDTKGAREIGTRIIELANEAEKENP